MAEVPPSPPSSEPSLREIRALLEEIRQQNIVLKRYICILAGGLTLSILLQLDIISTVINYAVIVLIVMAVMLTAPMWSQIVVALTDRIPWYPKRKTDPRDSAAGPA